VSPFWLFQRISRVFTWNRALPGSWGKTTKVEFPKSQLASGCLLLFRCSADFRRLLSGISQVEQMEEGETDTWALLDESGTTVLKLLFNLVVRPA